MQCWSLTDAIGRGEEKIRDHFLSCQNMYKQNADGEPVVVLTGININEVDTAMRLWESNDATYMKVMLVDEVPPQGSTVPLAWASTYKLVIYEIVTDIHEMVAEFLARPIIRHLEDLHCEDLIVSTGTADSKRAVGASTIQADKSYKRRTGFDAGELELTFVIEVAWSQKLGPSTVQSSLLGKTKDWISIGAGLVLAVKLYGYLDKDKPGMLLFVVNKDNRIVRAVQAGVVPAKELAVLGQYGENNMNEGLIVLSLEENRTVSIDMNDILGLASNASAQAEMDRLFPAEGADVPLGESSKEEKRKDMRAALQALVLRGDGFGEVELNIWKCYHSYFLGEYQS